jgi:hypothetical protein
MCKNKFTKIKADYLRWKESQHRTGAERVNFKYENVMETMFGEQHHISPKVLLSGTGVISAASTSCQVSCVLPETKQLISIARSLGKIYYGLQEND